MPDGSKWDVPAEVIAHSRADYYKEDGYDAEFKYTMGSDYELLDWASNNMDWADVKSLAVRVVEDEKEPNYQEGWVNGEKEIITK